LTPSAVWDKRGCFPILANRLAFELRGKMPKIKAAIRSEITWLARGK
jgi:hypothetical protein